MAQEQRFGMKVLTAENWVTPDSIHALFGLSDMTQASDPLEQGRRDVESLCTITLTSLAPVNVQAMFEVAKATMAYGWFFYPLYAVGADRLNMALELAVRTKFESLHGELTLWNYRRAIIWLCEREILNDYLCEWLQMSRDARNDALHAKFQSVYSFGSAVRAVHGAARLLREFYESKCPTASDVDRSRHHHLSPLDPRYPNAHFRYTEP